MERAARLVVLLGTILVAICLGQPASSPSLSTLVHNNVVINSPSSRIDDDANNNNNNNRQQHAMNFNVDGSDEKIISSPEGYYVVVLNQRHRALAGSRGSNALDLFRRHHATISSHDDYHHVGRHALMVYFKRGEITAMADRRGPHDGDNVVRSLHRVSTPLVKLAPELQRYAASVTDRDHSVSPLCQSQHDTGVFSGNAASADSESRKNRVVVKIGVHLSWRQTDQEHQHYMTLLHHLVTRGHLTNAASSSSPISDEEAAHMIHDESTLELLRMIRSMNELSSNVTSSRDCQVNRISSKHSTSKTSIHLHVHVPADEKSTKPLMCSCRRLLRELGSLPFVRWVEQAPTCRPLNSVATKTMQSSSDFSRPLWAHGITGDGQLVAVGDTGLDFDSCYFRDDAHDVAFYPATNPNHRKILSYQECEDDGVAPDHSDHAGAHGTHVAGSLSGNSLGGGGDYDGMAKDAVIFFQDLTCTGDDSGLLLPPDNGDYFQPAYDIGARISSNSWGSGDAPKSYGATDRLTDRFCYNHQDFRVLFEAGNNPIVGVLTPAASKNVLTVGAHNNNLDASMRDSLAVFSAHGPTYDNRIKPEVTGPGNPVVSAYSDGIFKSNQCTTTSKSGTSMATPLVSGAAVLLRQYLAEGYYPGGWKNVSNAVATPSASAMKALMIQSAVKMKSAGNGFPNPSQGFGRVELDKICHIAPTSSSSASSIVPFQHLIDQPIVRHHETLRYCFNPFSTDSLPKSPVRYLKVTLAWIDAASAAEGATRSVINDLDLALVSGDGTVYAANGLPSGSYDRDNIVEQVWVLDPIPSIFFTQPFQVLVYGYDVQDYGPYNGQPFSVVVWGPGVERADGTVCAGLSSCPADCHGHGACIGGLCECEAGYDHVDCSVCDDDAVCNGNGKCDASLRCSCANHINPSSSDCSACAAGWFGPHCDGTCACNNGGTCNRTTGMCTCSQVTMTSPSSTGCWDGTDCSRCCEDFGGTQCNQRSFWCHDKKVRELTGLSSTGLIQVNGDPQYPSSTGCRWHLQALQPSWTIRLSFLAFQTEYPYDFLKLYDGPNSSSKLIKRYSGTEAKALTWVSSSADVFIYFQSDMLGDDTGFVIQFDVLRKGSCADVQCHGHGTCRVDSLDCACTGNFDSTTACSTCIADYTGVDCAVPVQASTPEPPPRETPVPRFTDNPNVAPSGAAGTPAPVECSGSTLPCLHGGVCSAAGTCSCSYGYSGLRCALQCPSFQNETVGGAPVVCNGRQMPPLRNCISSTNCGDCVDGYAGASCQVDMSTVIHLAHGAPDTAIITLATPATAASAEEWDRRRWSLVQFNASVLDRLGAATGVVFTIARVNVSGATPERVPPLLVVDVSVWEQPMFVFSTASAAAYFPKVPVHSSSIGTARLSVSIWATSAVLGLRLSSPTSAAQAAAMFTVSVEEVPIPASAAACFPDASSASESSSSATGSGSQPFGSSSASEEGAATTTTSHSVRYGGVLCRVEIEPNAEAVPTKMVTGSPIDPSLLVTGQPPTDGNSVAGALRNSAGLAIAICTGIATGLLAFAFLFFRDRRRHGKYSPVGSPAHATAAAARRSHLNDDGVEEDDAEFENIPAAAIAVGESTEEGEGDEHPTRFSVSAPRNDEMEDLAHDEDDDDDHQNREEGK